MKQVEVYTDGACSGNPGPGGWGAVLRYRFDGKVYEKELSGALTASMSSTGWKRAGPRAGSAGAGKKPTAPLP